jgi:hypothetical protein
LLLRRIDERRSWVPHRRPRQRGSFGGHFDELVMHFPAEEKPHAPAAPNPRSPELQEKIDVHRRLFELAWRMDGGSSGRP